MGEVDDLVVAGLVGMGVVAVGQVVELLSTFDAEAFDPMA